MRHFPALRISWGIFTVFLTREDAHSCRSCIQSLPNVPTEVHLTGSQTLAGWTVVSRIRDIIASRDEAGLADYLTGEAAQTFVDVFHEVCLPVPPLPTHALIALLFLFQSGCRFFQPSATAPEEMLEYFVPNLRSSGYTSQFATNSSPLRPVEHPAVQGRVRGRVERPIPRPARCHQGHESVPEE